MFNFEWPWLGLLALLPLIVRLVLPAVKRKQLLPILRFPHLEELKNSFAAFLPKDAGTSRLFIILLSLLWICLVLALMRPQIVNQLTEVENEGYDIMLAVDLSGSMRALDFSKGNKRVNRLDIAKEVVSNFVQDRKDDRIGLVLFGDHAYQYAPLTQDTPAVSKMLDDTVVSMAGDGTAIGDAIGLAVKGLRDRPEKSKIIILLTDGEDNASSIPPLQAAKLAKDYGIRIYTIGVGSNGPVPYPDQYGRIVMANIKLDEKLLREIADTTGGSYYRATDTTALEHVYEQINKLEKSKSEKRQYLIRTPLYRYPLGAALGLLALIALIPLVSEEVRKRQYGF